MILNGPVGGLKSFVPDYRIDSACGRGGLGFESILAKGVSAFYTALNSRNRCSIQVMLEESLFLPEEPVSSLLGSLFSSRD